MTTTGSTPGTGLTDDQLAELHRVQLHIAQHVKRVCDELGLAYVFKASFDKANRSSNASCASDRSIADVNIDFASSITARYRSSRVAK